MKLELMLLGGIALGVLLAILAKHGIAEWREQREFELMLQRQQAQHELMVKQLVAAAVIFMAGYYAGIAKKRRAAAERSPKYLT